MKSTSHLLRFQVERLMTEKLALAEKVWRDHIVRKGENGEPDLLYIDFQLLH